ncbi:MAG: NADH-quinone oxidoreductase subunit L [Gemmatimonadetes bacterium]|nr:NADH-quinone oxidoreductase subunit L [Gemmatimonadota bacterium]
MAPSFSALLQAAVPPHPLADGPARWFPVLILLPLLGAVVNGAVALARRPSSARHPLVTLVGPGVLAAAFAYAVQLFAAMRAAGDRLTAPFIVGADVPWIRAGGLSLSLALQLDQLSVLMVLVITGVGTLIHVYSVGYMRDDPGYARYFAYLNLFVACMLVLVLGASYPLLFVGWEGVGLASYLLIGFWFTDLANARAGQKAFIVNRIGDAGFLAAMAVMWAATGALDFAGVQEGLGSRAGDGVVSAVALLLLLACAGKSAQLPLYVWLPDAMAGPTPVSALIHAATMVTAGVYLVARSAALFAAAPAASLAVAAVGALTALFAATVALRQWDIKRVLAYSTVSQLGYMFIGVGVGAYTAGVFHLVTHAFFKALLFLGAGSVIHAMHHAYHAAHREDDPQDLRNMGGLVRHLPVTAAMMLVATLAIAGVPPLAGFFSKDEILAAVVARSHGTPLADASLLGIPGSTVLLAIYAVGILTAFLTAAYMTRMLVYAFFGANRSGEDASAALHEVAPVMTAPVVALGALSIAGGWLNLPALLPLGPVGLLDGWLGPVTGAASRKLGGDGHLAHNTEVILVGVAVTVAVLGMVMGAWRARGPLLPKALAPEDRSLLARAYDVDAWLDRLVVGPVRRLAERGLAAGVERALDEGASAAGRALVRGARGIGARLQDGDVGRYSWWLAGGAVALVALLVAR